MTSGVSVRNMTAADLGTARSLVGQLGYDVPADDLAARFQAVSAAGGRHALLVAERDGSVVGLLHVFARAALEKPTEAVVQSLVVDTAVRGSGVGRLLMDRAEAWARENGFHSVALHTQIHRAEARKFYANLGYEEVNQSVLMRTTLADDD